MQVRNHSSVQCSCIWSSASILKQSSLWKAILKILSPDGKIMQRTYPQKYLCFRQCQIHFLLQILLLQTKWRHFSAFFSPKNSSKWPQCSATQQANTKLSKLTVPFQGQDFHIWQGRWHMRKILLAFSVYKLKSCIHRQGDCHVGTKPWDIPVGEDNNDSGRCQNPVIFWPQTSK